MRKFNICLIGSAGGHMQQLLEIKNSFVEFNHFYVTFYSPIFIDFKENNKIYYIKDASKSIYNLLVNVFQSAFILIKERPSLIISTGAGVAVPTLLLGYIFNIKIIYIELFCQVNHFTKTGNLIYRIADLFIVQSRVLQTRYPKAIYLSDIDLYKAHYE